MISWRRETQTYLRLMCLLAGVLAASAQLTPEQEAEIASYMAENYGTIAVSGTVVDEATQSISGVAVEVSQITDMGECETEQRDVGTTFSYSFTSAAQVVLFFFKDGYRGDRLDYAYSAPAAGVRSEGGTQYYDNIAVILRAMTNNPVTPYDVELALYTNGSCIAWNASNVVAGGDMRGRRVREDDPTSAVYPRMYPRAHAGGGVEIMITDGADGGFAGVDYAGGNYGDRLADMALGPDVGYEPVLAITEPRIVATSNNLYFYFKINSLYGKGCILSLLQKPDGGISIDMLLRVQSDGTRNLQSYE